MNKNQIACELSRIVEDNYNIDAYGIRHCKKEYTEADLYEKVLQLYILQTDHDCDYYRKLEVPKLKEFEGFVLLKEKEQPIVNVVNNYTLSKYNKSSGKTITQSTPLSIWNIYYGKDFGYVPTITVTDSNGMIIQPDIQYLPNSTIRLTFSSPVTGIVYLS